MRIIACIGILSISFLSLYGSEIEQISKIQQQEQLLTPTGEARKKAQEIGEKLQEMVSLFSKNAREKSNIEQKTKKQLDTINKAYTQCQQEKKILATPSKRIEALTQAGADQTIEGKYDLAREEVRKCEQEKAKEVTQKAVLITKMKQLEQDKKDTVELGKLELSFLQKAFDVSAIILNIQKSLSLLRNEQINTSRQVLDQQMNMLRNLKTQLDEWSLSEEGEVFLTQKQIDLVMEKIAQEHKQISEAFIKILSRQQLVPGAPEKQIIPSKKPEEIIQVKPPVKEEPVRRPERGGRLGERG